MYESYHLFAWIVLCVVVVSVGLALAYRTKHNMPIVRIWKDIGRLQKTSYIVSAVGLVVVYVPLRSGDLYFNQFLTILAVAMLLGVFLSFLVSWPNPTVDKSD
jgi:hypothetical protein